MTVKKVYKVTFKGVILPGFDKDQVIENVHTITRIPKHTIIRKFFSGKTVVIRHADSQEYATHLQKTFSQAGIETYITELDGQLSEDEPLTLDSEEISEDNAQNESAVAPVELEKTRLSKKILAFASVILFSVVILFFLNTNKVDPLTGSDLKVEDFSMKVEDSSMKVKDSSGIKVDTKDPLPAFITNKQLTVLIKITNKTELKRLSQFIRLLDIKSDFPEVIKQAVNAEKSDINISDKSPLYVFKLKTQENETQGQTGIFLSTKRKLPQALISELQNKLAQSLKSSFCAKTPGIKVVNTDNHLLLTTINDTEQLISFKNLSQQKQLEDNLLQLDQLFHQSENSKNATFNIYYLNHAGHNNTDNLKYSSHIALSAVDDNFWLSPDKSFSKKNTELLKQLNLNAQNANKLSALKTNDLFNLILLLIAQSDDDFFIQTQTDPLFAQEPIIKINKNYSPGDIKPYKNELDIDLSAQWQSGPFALTTSQFKFDKNLLIEILAKGQNINNLMEYSHSALLRIHSVLNKNNENILSQDCSGLSNSKQAHSETYFRDLDGEQEAYINDDFVSYHTITAKKDIPIKPGYNNHDINTIEGEILLQLPEKIQKKTVSAEKNIGFTRFENFSILLQHYPETNSLQYKVTGQTNHFITLRAYNSRGAASDTLSLKKKSLFDNNIRLYQQQFSQPIKRVEVFYAKKNKVINYPFAFKPEITSATTLLAGPDETDDSAQEEQLISFSGNNLGLKPLKNEILLDNPAWLGQKWPGEKNTGEPDSPFYVELFTHDIDTDKKTLTDKNTRDAVLNIKSSVSPLISQNITAVKLTLSQGNVTLLDNFISFNSNEFFADEGEDNAGNQTEGKIKSPEVSQYLNSNSAFELSKDNKTALHGVITLSLPATFKTHASQYSAPGQVIRLADMSIKVIQLSKNKIQFEINGAIKKLVQLKLFNTNNHLISEPLEFKHLKNNKARLTLFYSDQIDRIKVILSHDASIKKYPFSFKN